MISRRRFIGNTLVALGSAPFLTSPARASGSRGLLSKLATETVYHEVLDATIPKGAILRVIARSGERVGSSDYVWHGLPDGGACFAMDDGGWVYVSNSEFSDGEGGVGAIRFTADGRIADAYPILEGTTRNCAGGKTPWGTWLSCEENGDLGQVYECDPTGRNAAIVRPGMGSCNHEAAAVDPSTSRVYLTEDIVDGCLYRFTPVEAGNLERGLLEVGVPDGSRLKWVALIDPSAISRPLREQIPEAARFHGGEGIVYGNRHVYFTTKKDDRVWSLNVDTNELRKVYDAAEHDEPILTGVDNIEISHDGELLVAEDGGDMQIVVLDNRYNAIPLVTLHGQPGSEIAGPAFTPDGSRLLFSSQKGALGDPMGGTTYELLLPV